MPVWLYKEQRIRFSLRNRTKWPIAMNFDESLAVEDLQMSSIFSLPIEPYFDRLCVRRHVWE